jgi:hypoxanthine phosphoribosyltransferase
VTVPSSPTPAPRVLLDEAALRDCVARVANEIQRDHPDGVVLVGVLKGALIFLADLARALTDIEVRVDFIAISRYAPDSGRVRILHDVAIDLAGRDVILVEDLVDTGLTLAYLLEHLRARGPRQLDVCTLLDRTARRIVPLDVRYVGIEIPDVFVLGYGLHQVDLYRNLPRVVEADPRLVRENPAVYLDALYHAALERAPSADGGRLAPEVAGEAGARVAPDLRRRP